MSFFIACRYFDKSENNEDDKRFIMCYSVENWGWSTQRFEEKREESGGNKFSNLAVSTRATQQPLSSQILHRRNENLCYKYKLIPSSSPHFHLSHYFLLSERMCVIIKTKLFFPSTESFCCSSMISTFIYLVRSAWHESGSIKLMLPLIIIQNVIS